MGPSSLPSPLPTTSTPSPFPPPTPSQPKVTISPLAGGYITLPTNSFVSPPDDNAPSRTVPSLSFLISHPTGPRTDAHPLSILPPKPTTATSRPYHVLFDLGLRKHASLYPLPLQRHLERRAPHALGPGVAAQLRAGGLDPAVDVDLVVISHVHYDHHGDPEDFASARFVLGPGATGVLAGGLGGAGSHQHFDPSTFPAGRTFEVPGVQGGLWRPLGPFPFALDLFADRSVYVIHAPGHLPGHISLLCRTAPPSPSPSSDPNASAPSRWVLLAGDTYHDRRLLTGAKNIGTWMDAESGEEHCIHFDRAAAAVAIGRVRQMLQLAGEAGEEVEAVAAHEEEWWEEARKRGRMFPGKM
ncbi:hypothetical protein K431DRAFT_283169 [Polychaeton citri CBS 116435]|uniref:Metallo-hydrolase/oxidoreductase n=1 Tax=Polychaeton citri CBS 116435 TaxID=1314669 RepID=A0A9P4QEB9_9PEZI|nr:hypothetical protein K431DRAFT_283169 [Polychaeton citri CBS 116435]